MRACCISVVRVSSMDCWPRGFWLRAAVLAATPWRPLLTVALPDLCGEDLGEVEAVNREDEAALGPFTLVVLDLVLMAAARGEVQSRAAEASRTVVLVLDSDNIN